VLTIAWIGAVIGGTWWARERVRRDVASWAGLLITTLMLCQRLFSPQYLAWLIPVVVVLALRGRMAGLWCFVVASALTTFFLCDYNAMLDGNLLVRSTILLRNLVVAAMAGIFLAELRRNPPAEPAGQSEDRVLAASIDSRVAN
jgi:hypothetical protein